MSDKVSKYQRMAEDRIRELMEHFKRQNPALADRVTTPQIYFDVKGKTAGKAERAGRYVNFNLPLMVDNWHYFYDDTIPHELAHALVGQLMGTGVQPHGRHWKHMCRLLVGRELPRCHRLDVTKVKGRRRTRYLKLKDRDTNEIYTISRRRYQSFINAGRALVCAKTRRRINYEIVGEVLE